MKAILLTLYILLVAKATLSFGNETPSPVIRTKQGLVSGISETSVNGRDFYSYLGVPFAEPPVGNRRFKDPVPVAPWEDTLYATKYPPNCLQNELISLSLGDKSKIVVAGEEDCLYLNVHTARPNEVEAKYPVMVFIHGGGFVCGSTDVYQPYLLLDDDIILVTIQYRLGIFGFLSTEDSVLPGNMGLKDQQLALKWIKENIQSFGGDPERVTIFGESAGSASVHFQILSPGSKGLFQRAILESGTAFCPWATTTDHRKFALETGNQFGCSIDQGTESFLECMQNADAHKLLELDASTVEWGFGPLYTLPRVDGVFIEDHPEILLKEERYNKVDVIAGLTRDEGAFSMLMLQKNPLMLDQLKTNFDKYGPLSLYLYREPNGAKMAKKIFDFYLKGKSLSSTTSLDDNLMELYSDALFGFSVDTFVRFLAHDEDVSLYVYQLDHFGEFSLLSSFGGFDRHNWIGHADDLSYLFYGGHFFPQKLRRDDDILMGRIIRSLWANFAKRGNPTPIGSPLTWEKATGNKFKRLSLKPNLEMVDYDFLEKRKLWSSLKTNSNVLLGIYKDDSKTEL